MAQPTDKPSRKDANPREADYRKAAEAALGQLDWVISYLHRIRKADIARALARNRSDIQRRITSRPEE
jgi:hypothetical protein